MTLLQKTFLSNFEVDEKKLLTYIQNIEHACIVVHPDLYEWLQSLQMKPNSYIVKETDIEAMLACINSVRTYLIVSPNEISLKPQIAKAIGVQRSQSKNIYRLFNDIFTYTTCSIPPHKVPYQEPIDLFKGSINLCLVVSLPRSGSTFFVDTFEQSDKFGHPREHIRHDTAQLVKKGILDFKEFFTFTARNTCTKNNVFMTKIIDGFFLDMYNGMTADEQHFVNKLFKHAKVVYLERENKVSQAISAYKSKLSGKYHSTDDGVTEVEVPYDFEDLNQTYNAYIQKEKVWKEFIEEHVPEFIYVKYEDFVKNTQDYFMKIAAFLEVDVTESDYKHSKYEKVSNKNSDELKVNFKRDLMEKGIL